MSLTSASAIITVGRVPKVIQLQNAAGCDLDPDYVIQSVFEKDDDVVARVMVKQSFVFVLVCSLNLALLIYMPRRGINHKVDKPGLKRPQEGQELQKLKKPRVNSSDIVQPADSRVRRTEFSI